MRKRTDFILTLKVMSGAAAALLVLAAWLIHPEMSGEMSEAGRSFVWLLMLGIGVAAILALLLGRDSNSR